MAPGLQHWALRPCGDKGQSGSLSPTSPLCLRLAASEGRDLPRPATLTRATHDQVSQALDGDYSSIVNGAVAPVISSGIAAPGRFCPLTRGDGIWNVAAPILAAQERRCEHRFFSRSSFIPRDLTKNGPWPLKHTGFIQSPEGRS